MRKRALASVAMAIMFLGAAAAGPLEDGSSAYQRGDYATALRLWRPLAEHGDPRVQYNLGLMYGMGSACRWMMPRR